MSTDRPTAIAGADFSQSVRAALRCKAEIARRELEIADIEAELNRVKNEALGLAITEAEQGVFANIFGETVGEAKHR